MKYSLHSHYGVLERLAKHCSSYLEVGVQEGGSLMAVLESNPEICTVLLFDTWDSSHGGTSRGNGDHIIDKWKVLQPIGTSGTLQIIDGKSQDTVPSFTPRDGQLFDLTHIDGSHDYNDVVQDLNNVWPVTATYMVVHDIKFPQVWQAVYEFGEELDRPAICHFKDQGTAVFVKPGFENGMIIFEDEVTS